MESRYNGLRNFILSLLADDSGISEQSWQDMNDYLQNMGEFELLGSLVRHVKEVDNRYYLK